MAIYVGNTLTVTPATATTRIGPAPTNSYQWYRDGVAIPGATSDTYTLVEADTGATITVRQTASNVRGSSSATSAGQVVETQWLPTALFASGEVGAWYDPSDLDTMFVQRNEVATAVEQSVCLILDKSQGLAESSELVANGTFDDVTGWTLQTGWAVTGGQLSSIDVGGTFLTASTNIGNTAAGAWYKLTFNLVSVEANRYHDRFFLSIGGAATATAGSGDDFASYGIGETGTHTVYIQSKGTDANLYFTAGGFNGYVIDNVSCVSVAGNHAYQATAASRPILRARHNLLTYSEDFRNTADAGETRPWVYSVYTLTPSATTAPDGTMTATKIVMDSLTANKIQRLTHSITAFPFVANESRVVSCYMKAGEANWGVLGIDNNSGVYAGAYINLTTGAVTTYNAANLIGGGITATAEDVGSGWYRLKVVINQGATPYGTAVHVKSSVSQPSGTSADVDGDGTSGIYVWGVQLNYGSTILPYQRIAAATAYVTSSTMETYDFPYYLDFDGVDDSLATAAIDFSATDEMSAFAGVTKLSDAAGGVLYELTITGTSSAIYAPDSAAARYAFRSKSILATAPSSYAAPITNVVTGLSDISEDKCIIRINGTQVASSASDQGAGNYANDSVYIGARAGTAAYFNGYIYSLIVRGKTSTADEIAATESYVAGKTGVTLP